MANDIGKVPVTAAQTDQQPLFSDAEKSAMERWTRAWMKSTLGQQENLREWCEAILCEFAGPDLEPSRGVIEQLTQVVECRSKEIAAARIATLEQARDALRQALQALIIDANRLCDRQLGGTYEDDCRRSIDKARTALEVDHGCKGEG